ncbi:MAG: L-threonylcarbamoyladenylate synthase [Syntrophales bacterium]
MTVHLKCDPVNPDEKVLAEAVNILRRGGVVAFPTETFYGLGADAHQGAAVEKIFHLKGRNAQNPISVIVDNDRQAILLVDEVPPAAQLLMQAFWPGPLTMLLHASPSVLPRLTGGTGKIGIRVSSHRVAHMLAKGLAGPLTATSANLSGERECSTAEEVIRAFGERLDAVIDGGETAGGLGSTILDVTVSPPVVRREGVVSRREIIDALGRIPPH